MTWYDLLEYESDNYFIIIEDIQDNTMINDKNFSNRIYKKPVDCLYDMPISGYVLSKKDKNFRLYLTTHTFYDNDNYINYVLKKYGFRKKKAYGRIKNE